MHVSPESDQDFLSKGQKFHQELFYGMTERVPLDLLPSRLPPWAGSRTGGSGGGISGEFIKNLYYAWDFSLMGPPEGAAAGIATSEWYHQKKRMRMVIYQGNADSVPILCACGRRHR